MLFIGKPMGRSMKISNVQMLTQDALLAMRFRLNKHSTALVADHRPAHKQDRDLDGDTDTRTKQNNMHKEIWQEIGRGALLGSAYRKCWCVVVSQRVYSRCNKCKQNRSTTAGNGRGEWPLLQKRRQICVCNTFFVSARCHFCSLLPPSTPKYKMSDRMGSKAHRLVAHKYSFAGDRQRWRRDWQICHVTSMMSRREHKAFEEWI